MPTTNPVPSADPSDLLFNAGKLDEVVNSASATYSDRLGATRRTLKGLETAATGIPAVQASIDAVAAKVAAEAARDAAMLSAGVYATTEAGLAATTSGRYFSVPSTDSAEYLILYQNSGGTAVETKRYPSISAIDSIKLFATEEATKATSALINTSGTDLHQFADQEGNIVASVSQSGDFKAIDFKTETASLSIISEAIEKSNAGSYTHVFSDVNGSILFGLRQDGTIESEIPVLRGYGLAEVRAGLASYADMNTIGLNLDANARAESPLNLTFDVALYGADGTKSQRMPLVIKTGQNELCVIYHQLGVDGTDQSYVALAQRFVTYDLTAQTASVSATTQIVGDAINSALVYHGANAIELKNGNFLLTYGHDLKQYKKISTDRCRTWSAPTVIVDDPDLKHGVANGLVRIQGGPRDGRLVLALWGGTTGSTIGDNVGCFYSDDDGATWIKGGIIRSPDFGAGVDAINEVSVACDASNNLIFAIRNEGYGSTPAVPLYKCIFAISKDGGKTLQKYGEPRFDAAACQMSVLQCAPTIYSGMPKIVMASPTTLAFTRRKFRIRVSYDNLQSFAAEYAPFADDLDVAYSSLAFLENNVIAVAYETGATNVSQSVKIKFLNIAEIF